MKYTRIQKFKDWLTVTLNPMYWISNGRISRALDRKLNALMDSGVEPTNVSSYTSYLGQYRVWISNYPYAYGSIENIEGMGNVYPYRRTRVRLRRYIDDALYAKRPEEFND